MTPRRERKSPHTSDHGAVLVKIDAVVVPGDTHFPGRERRGRPVRSPEERAALAVGDIKHVEFTDSAPDSSADRQ